MDLISRQDAIDAVEFGITYAKAINKSTGEVKELFKEGNKALNEAVERIKDLPSAQPEPMSDLISRQAAIDEIEERKTANGYRNVAVISELNRLEGYIMRLPSVTPKCPECDDAVSREAAIDAALSAFSRGLLASPDIRRLPSVQSEPQWIPCSERLPEENVPVLLGVRFKDDFKFFVSARIDYNYWSGLGREIKGELRWMPLPEPYRAERRTDD